MPSIFGHLAGKQRAQPKTHQDVEIANERHRKIVAPGHLWGQDAQHEHGKCKVDDLVEQLQAHGHEAVFCHPLDGGVVFALAVETPPQPVEGHESEHDDRHKAAIQPQLETHRCIGKPDPVRAFLQPDGPEIAIRPDDGHLLLADWLRSGRGKPLLVG